jgi:hypothetical protein
MNIGIDKAWTPLWCPRCQFMNETARKQVAFGTLFFQPTLLELAYVRAHRGTVSKKLICSDYGHDETVIISA